MRLRGMCHFPNTHNIAFKPNDARRPDFFFDVFSPKGRGHIYLEIDECFHDACSIESEQRRHTAFSLYSRDVLCAETIFWVRFQSGYTKLPNEDQMKTLDAVLKECKGAIRMGNKKGIHMIMIDYPHCHYHTIANQERVVPAVDFEVKMAESEAEFHLPLFNSFRLECTPGFKHGYDRLDESLQMEEDDDEVEEDDLKEPDEVKEVEEKVEEVVI